MVDKKDNEDDEYNFADLDDISSDMHDEESSYKPEETSSESVGELDQGNDKRLYVLIAVASLIGIFLLYRFLGSYFSGPAVPSKAQVKAPTPIQAPIKTTEPEVKTSSIEPPPTSSAPKESAPVAPVVVSATPSPEIPQIKQKLDDMELTQQNLKTDVTTIKAQLEGLNTSISALTTKMADLSQAIATLSTAVEQQSVRTTACAPPKVAHKKTRKMPVRFVVPPLAYNIQAVIPGRAWLIASNGSTLTVREGSEISGYGIVRLIDAVQGRVTMSSGRVIRFSQQDS